ncbi:MAG: hypothetical protein JSS72_06030 [Armatimonadetes bacterium]|nr:hypothetical protein [Armatimonadota bacterium]
MKLGWIAPLLGLALASCAKFPSGGSGASGKRLTFTMTVNREINPNYVYIFALRPTNDVNPTDQGPIPVIGPPWGNGFVAGNCSYFVRWDPLQSPKYQIYKFQDVNLTQYFSIGSPVNYVDVQPGGRTLQFDIDLSQIANSIPDAQAYQSLQVNLLTMDRVPQGGSGGSKVWDALGDSQSATEINTWVTIPLNVASLYNNQRFNNLEPSGDCPDPDLDIIDWSINVNLQ